LSGFRDFRATRRLAFGCALWAALPALLAAGSFSFTGAFTQDDDKAMFSFNIASTETVTMRTWSYAGGINAAGASIASGGFDPVLTLFDSSGNWQGANDDGTGVVATDASTGNAFDSWLSLDLTPGDYELFLTESDNIAIDSLLSDGFTEDGQGDFTCPEYLGISGAFCDATPAFRTGDYAVDILNADSVAAQTPEPGTGLTLMLALAAFALGRFKRRGRRP